MSEGAHRGQTELTYVRRRSQSSSEAHRGPRGDYRDLTDSEEAHRGQTELMAVRRSSKRSYRAHRSLTEPTEV